MLVSDRKPNMPTFRKEYVKMTKQELLETAKPMIAAQSCCQELKTAAQAWIDAVGTAGEKAAADALLAELKEDVCTIDHALAFFESPRAAQYFGEEKAKEFAALARETKAKGGKWCFCGACAAGSKLMENAESFAC